MKLQISHDELRKNSKSQKSKNKFKKNFKFSSPIICEVVMDPNEEQIPKANRRNKEAKSIPTDFEDMYPFCQEMN